MIPFIIGPQNPPKYQTCITLITLFLILQIVQSKILAHSESFTTINGWQVISNNAHDSRIITCGASNVLFIHNQSPVEYSAMYFKTYEIQPHYKIEAEFNFWTIDYWNANYFIVYCDTLVAHASFYSTTSTTNLCAVSNLYDESFLINFQKFHYGSTVSISFLSSSEKFGISDFKLYIHECPQLDVIHAMIKVSFDSRSMSTINTMKGWSTNDIVSTLVGNIVDISYHKFTGNSITKEITLNQHEAISVYIRVMVFNSDSTKIYIKIDDVLISTTSYTDG
ncbi:unnamed protein product [Paramecium octaurelia]|uniref:Uncharacterized protein n=1 Tax=Paramecium octaurelia TaxID=43137 RepID=A0A8S1YMF1_PAROT|nr:unnamed protein product [Paramecium octaurelia]